MSNATPRRTAGSVLWHTGRRKGLSGTGGGRPGSAWNCSVRNRPRLWPRCPLPTARPAPMTSAQRPLGNGASVHMEIEMRDQLPEVNPGDPLYRDLQLRGKNRRFVGTPDSVYVVADTRQVVAAVGRGRLLGKEARGAQRRALYGRICRRSRGRVRDRSRPNGFGVLRPGAARVRGGGRRHVRSVVSGSRSGLGSDPSRQHLSRVSAWAATSSAVVSGHCHGCMAAMPIICTRSNLWSSTADGQAKQVFATRDEDDPNRDLWWAHTGGGGGNFGVATKFWFRSRDAHGRRSGAAVAEAAVRVHGRLRCLEMGGSRRGHLHHAARQLHGLV